MSENFLAVFHGIQLLGHELLQDEHFTSYAQKVLLRMMSLFQTITHSLYANNLYSECLAHKLPMSLIYVADLRIYLSILDVRKCHSNIEERK